MEPAAAELAAKRATEAQIRTILDAAYAMHPEADDMQALFDADCRFHVTILDATHNQVMRQLRQLIITMLHVSYDFGVSRPENDPVTRQGHILVAEAIACRDGKAARKNMSTMLEKNKSLASRTLKKALAQWAGRHSSLLGHRPEGKRMRGLDARTGELFSYVDLEARVRAGHPLRPIRAIVNEALSALEQELAPLYARIGRPSIPPEKLLESHAPTGLRPIRSERQLMERLEYDLLFRWFVGLWVDDPAWDHSTFSKNRDRLLEGDIATKILGAVLAQPRVKQLSSTGPLLGRRHPDRGLGFDEELQAQGWLGRAAARRGTERRGGLPG